MQTGPGQMTQKTHSLGVRSSSLPLPFLLLRAFQGFVKDGVAEAALCCPDDDHLAAHRAGAARRLASGGRLAGWPCHAADVLGQRIRVAYQVVETRLQCGQLGNLFGIDDRPGDLPDVRTAGALHPLAGHRGRNLNIAAAARAFRGRSCRRLRRRRLGGRPGVGRRLGHLPHVGAVGTLDPLAEGRIGNLQTLSTAGTLRHKRHGCILRGGNREAAKSTSTP